MDFGMVRKPSRAILSSMHKKGSVADALALARKASMRYGGSSGHGDPVHGRGDLEAGLGRIAEGGRQLHAPVHKEPSRGMALFKAAARKLMVEKNVSNALNNVQKVLNMVTRSTGGKTRLGADEDAARRASVHAHKARLAARLGQRRGAVNQLEEAPIAAQAVIAAGRKAVEARYASAGQGKRKHKGKSRHPNKGKHGHHRPRHTGHHGRGHKSHRGGKSHKHRSHRHGHGHRRHRETKDGAGRLAPMPEEEEEEASEFDRELARECASLPKGWTAVESRSRPGHIVYRNKLNGDKPVVILQTRTFVD